MILLEQEVSEEVKHLSENLQKKKKKKRKRKLELLWSQMKLKEEGKISRFC